MTQLQTSDENKGRAVPLLFLSDWSSIALGRAGSPLPPCLGTNKMMLGFGSAVSLLLCCSNEQGVQASESYVQVQGVISGEHGCAATVLQPCYHK